jgi:ubiquinone/menaquinone biosynthesis C-methylase UbiE
LLQGAPEEKSTKLNWGERLAVNNPVRVLQQRMEIYWMAKACAAGSFARALEVGCGRGAGARLILTAFKPLDLFATDLDMEMMQKAAGYLSLKEKKTVHLCAADLLNLPFPDRSMDALFGFGVLHHIVDWRAALSEISRVLRPNAFYFIEELYPSLYQNWLTKRFLLHPTKDRFTGADLKEALGRAGLSLIAARELKKVGILAVARRTTLSPLETSIVLRASR